jgi:O-methyltransferase
VQSDSIPQLFAGLSGPPEAKEELRLVLERLAHLLKSLDPWQTDNLITFARNLSFLQDARLRQAVTDHANHDYDKAIIWRTHVLTWAGANALNVEGDFVECGTHLGYSVSVLCDYLKLDTTGKEYWCYDLFEGKAYERFDLGGKEPIEFLRKRFSKQPYVHLVKGSVPDSFADGAPHKVAFLHLDLNSATAERGALEYLLPKMSKGAMLVLDDYGWKHYKAQKVVADEILGAKSIPIMELPTGQGLAIIR